MPPSASPAPQTPPRPAPLSQAQDPLPLTRAIPLLAVALTILAGEALASRCDAGLSHPVQELVHGGLIMALTLPSLFFFFVRPLRRALRDKTDAQETLWALCRDLDDKVGRRTRELEEANASLRQVSARQLEVREDERKRVAQELHDGIGQSLTAVRSMVDQALRGACGQPRSCHLDVLQQVTPVLRQTVEETRRICMALRPSTLDDLGLIATLRWFTRELQKTCPGLAIDLDIGLEEATLPEPLKTGIFRIVQEALGNAARHAGARRVEVVLGWDRSVLELTVADDGVGFDPQAKANPAGLGLDAMKEWAGLHDGALRLDTAPGQGTLLTVRWRTDEPAA